MILVALLIPTLALSKSGSLGRDAQSPLSLSASSPFVQLHL